MKFKDLIYTSKICPLPWVGAMVKPVGTFSSCCVQDDRITNPHSSLENNSLQEVRNNDYWKQLRKDLINGVEHPSCKDCWHLEKNGNTSLRQIRLDEFKYFLGDKLLELEVHDDGSLSDETIYFWDVRQTNLCNMKCIMCGPDYSSLWREELIRQHGHDDKLTGNAVIDANQISKEDFFLDIQKGILDVEQFYFAGGEPLISDTHWKILELLIQNKRTDVRLSYNTNLLKTTFKGKNVLDYWKQWNEWKVEVWPSIDEIGDRAELIRSGTVWSKVENNLKAITALDNVWIRPGITVGAWNVRRLPIIINHLINIGVIKEKYKFQNFFINLLEHPTHYHVHILPDEYRQQTIKELHEFIMQHNKKYNTTIDHIFTHILHELTLPWNKAAAKKFVEVTKTIDDLRSEDLYKVIPEMNIVRDTNV